MRQNSFGQIQIFGFVRIILVGFFFSLFIGFIADKLQARDIGKRFQAVGIRFNQQHIVLL